jgi:hypothetical protein
LNLQKKTFEESASLKSLGFAKKGRVGSVSEKKKGGATNGKSLGGGKPKGGLNSGLRG